MRTTIGQTTQSSLWFVQVLRERREPALHSQKNLLRIAVVKFHFINRHVFTVIKKYFAVFAFPWILPFVLL